MKNRNWKLKYIIEWIEALLAITLLSPLLIFIAILIKIQDGGPVLYKSKRIGRFGKEFTFYKFRGMKIDVQAIISHEKKYIVFDNDTRLTKLGRLLRLGFDELPQLLNIIKGDMCLIGPRPSMHWDDSWGQQYDTREIKRLDVLPGITGLTQIVGGRSLHSRENYELDVRYVENSNIFTDILIFSLTIPYCFGLRYFIRRVFKKYLVNIPCQRTIAEIIEC